ncbi:MAG: molybdopterin adenylyltransferase [Gammaproteobacteria bacterium]
MPASSSPPVKIGRLTISDRASAGVYEDLSGPAIEEALAALFGGTAEFSRLLVPDERPQIASALRRLCDEEHCALVVTTGGTGPAPRDVTPESTLEILEKVLPGFGEIMRVRSFDLAPTSILSRAVAGIRGRSLVINLPGSPKAVRECLAILAPAIRECLKHLRES